MKRSKLLRLSKNDFVKGLIIAVITACLTALLQMLQNNQTVDYKQILTVSIIAVIGYLLKNLSTNESGELLKKD